MFGLSESGAPAARTASSGESKSSTSKASVFFMVPFVPPRLLLRGRKLTIEKFEIAHYLVSWLALCPDNRISGGHILKAKTRIVTNRVANILCAH